MNDENEAYAERDLLPISGLQHLMFCERQFALIHIEQQWDENRLTAEGRLIHERVHTAPAESRGIVRIVYGLHLRSSRLGLIGRADVVEFHRVEQKDIETRSGRLTGASLPGRSGLWRPVPVEHKRGKPKENRCDEVQLCGQTLCLEEMLGVRVEEGALFYGRTKRRQSVTFDEELRRITEKAAARMHELFSEGSTPQPENTRLCKRCSLRDRCMPQLKYRGSPVQRYLRTMTQDVLE